MTPARGTPAPSNLPPHRGDLRLADALEAFGPGALRALLLLSGAAHPGDPALARLDDDELQLLRLSVGALSAIETTSAA